MMAVDARVDKLSHQLSKHSLGPVDTLTDAAMVGLGSASAAIAVWLRRYAYDRPLITLLLSCQVGYLIGRAGRRHARR
jgi:hypothetical protein